MGNDLERKTLAELRKHAKEMGIPAISALKKSELIAKIEEKLAHTEKAPVKQVTAYGFSLKKQEERPEREPEQEEPQPRQRADRSERAEPSQKDKLMENSPIGEGILEVMAVFCEQIISCPAQTIFIFPLPRFAVSA